MSRDQSAESSEEDRALEREIRGNRKFTLEEAIGRLAGPGMMKGVSPITRQEQAMAELDAFLEQAMADASPVLVAVLARQVKASELFLNGFAQPITVLAAYVQQVLDSPYQLQELVRLADVEWGREFGERPYFEQPGRPPHPDDPFTFESVRGSLSTLVERVSARQK